MFVLSGEGGVMTIELSVLKGKLEGKLRTRGKTKPRKG